jgi:hypothetical protein
VLNICKDFFAIEPEQVKNNDKKGLDGEPGLFCRYFPSLHTRLMLAIALLAASIHPPVKSGQKKT